MIQLQAKLSGQSAFSTVATIEDRGDRSLVSILWSKQTSWIEQGEATPMIKTLEKVYKARNKGAQTKIVKAKEIEVKEEIAVVVEEIRDAVEALADEVEIDEEIDASADDEEEEIDA